MSDGWDRHKLIEYTGVTALYLYAFFAFAGRSVALLALVLMFVAFMLRPPVAWRELVRQPVVIFCAICLAYLGIRMFAGIREFPQTSGEQVGVALSFAGLWSFVFVAPWLNARRIFAVLGLALAGLIVGVLRKQPPAELLSLVLAGTRSGLGWEIPQAGLLYATAVVGLVAFAPRFCKLEQRPLSVGMRLMVWTILVVSFVEMLIITQSRISWIAAALVVPIVAALIAWRVIRDSRPIVRRRAIAVLVCGMGAMVVLAIANLSVVINRLEQIGGMTVAAERPAGTMAPNESVVLRVGLARTGVKRWLERPVFGWGPGTQVAPTAEGLLRTMDHLHNTYLEILARLGTFGFLLYAMTFLWIVRGVWRAYRASTIPLDVLLFVLGSFGVLAIWCVANYRFTSEWRYLVILLAAIAYSVSMRRSPASAYVAAGARAPA